MLDLSDLPPLIVPAVEAFAHRLAAHVRTHRDASLDAHEQGVLDAWRAVAGAVLSRVVAAATVFGAERIEIVDWWHAAEHPWELANDLHGIGTPAARAWAAAAPHRLWRHDPEALRPLLRQARARAAEAHQPLRRERAFFARKAARMAYPAFRRQDLPVGSGAVDGAAKHLVQQRLQRAACAGVGAVPAPSSNCAAPAPAASRSVSCRPPPNLRPSSGTAGGSGTIAARRRARYAGGWWRGRGPGNRSGGAWPQQRAGGGRRPARDQ